MSDAELAGVPGLVPARMVNEFCYCPRLFFLEWVQGRFVDNADTVEGRWRHRAVDREEGAAPLPEDGDITAAKSVMVSSEKLGVIARVDLIEGRNGVVRPVDTKRGSPPDIPHRAWEPERVQVCVQGLLLRDEGYKCDEGVLYFAETKQRVTVEFTSELIERSLELLAQLREAAGTDVPPPPLVASPKCPRCSLVGICLPDETNALATRSALAPRRLVPKGGSARPLYVHEQGASAGVSSGRLEISRKGEKLASIRLIDVSQLCVYGNVQVTSQLIRELFAREIPVGWFSYGGWFSGIGHGLPSKHIELRRRQVAIAHHGGLEIARKIVEGKIRNTRTLLRRNSRQRPSEILESLKQLAVAASKAQSIPTLLGIEGSAARLYFSVFSGMLREGQGLPGELFSFEGRNRRPPKDPINCLLSFSYALLVKDLTATALGVGFDPYLGFYHRPRFGRPALALDLAEEFRPLIAESVVINLVNNGEVKDTDFVVRAGGVALTANGRRAVVSGYERRLEAEIKHPMFGYTISYRRVLEVQARLLGAYLLDEIPHYVPFLTR